jgi:hypothetical protein
MTDAVISFWVVVLRRAVAELDAATCKSDLNTAASQLMRAKQQLIQLGVDWRPLVS